MKLSASIVIQAVIWSGIWSVFVFSGDAQDRLPGYYQLLTLRVLNAALFFNVAYYLLLPPYFAGRKRLFYLLSPLVFVAYVGLSYTLDWTVGAPENITANASRELHKRRRHPWFIRLIPPTFLGLTFFGVAATIRGFAAFEAKKKSEEEANRRRLEAELALLKSQINPHFLLNTLNNLYAIALTEPEKTPDALLRLSDMVRYLLYECAQPTVALARDLEFVENYIALQKLRLPPNAVLDVELPPRAPDRQIEPMILIPFIENAFKHGLTTRQPCTVSIAIRTNEEQLVLRVENDIFPHKPSDDQSGIGLANTVQRLGHSYPGRHELQFSDDGGRHIVRLVLRF
jgi:two-component system LytT family sensor kinase